jgi:hypothetical protein
MAHLEPTAALRYPKDAATASNDPTAAGSITAGTRQTHTTLNETASLEQRSREVMRQAQEAFAKTSRWVVFYREMLGPEGVVRQLFPEPEQLRGFETSREFGELQEMVAAMRSLDPSKGDASEPERMITIRLPASLHDALKAEADEMNLSINKLCISKLLQRIESRYIPIQQGRRRGRKPGPQGPRPKATKPSS